MDCETGQCPPVEPEAKPDDTAKTSSDDAGAAQLMDWRTFQPPLDAAAQSAIWPSIVIEFCNRCRWLHRAAWLQTELFVTFDDKQTDEPTTGKYATSTGLKSITLIPCNAPETGGRFRVWLYRDGGKGGTTTSTSDEKSPQKSSTTPHGTYQDNRVVLLWDRKIRAGFPELKELKQMVRDQIAPSHSLGHSDKKSA